MAINLRRLRAGEMPSPSEWNRLVELVEQLTRVSGSGDAEISFSQTGLQIYDNRPNEHWARIIRRDSEHEDGESPVGNKYAHVQVDVDVDGTATDLPAASGFIWGEPDYLPAIEVNESGDVPDGQVVRMVPSRVGPWFEFDCSESGNYLLAATSTPDSDGRFTSNEDKYNPDTDSWTTSKADVLAEPAIGITMQKGLRYPARATSDPGVFTTIADANEIIVSSVPVYFGGLVNTEMQVFKGPKAFRDRTDWAWEKGAKSHSYLTTSSKGTRHHWQGPDCFASLDVESQRSFNFVGDGGTGYVIGGSVGASGPGGMAEVFQLPSSAGPPFVPPTAGLYAMAGFDDRTEFRIYASWSDLHMALCSEGFTLANPVAARGRFGVTRDKRYYGIDAVYNQTTHGLLILGGIVVGTWELSGEAPSLPSDGDILLFDGKTAINPYNTAMVAIGATQRSYLDSVSHEDALYQQEYAEITGITSPPKKTTGGPPPPPPPP